MKRSFLVTLALTLVVVCGFTSRKATAQVDPHFSQYYAYPLWLNPALTGVMDGDFRLTANYKRQWASITDPYQTEALSFDTYPTKHFAFGATVLHQGAGDGGFQYMNAMGSAAYHAILDKAQMNVVSIGLQAGVVDRRFDPNKLKFGDQWNPVSGYDPGAASGENFDETNSTDLDVNVGIVYYNRNPNTKVNPFAGVSLYHLTQPEDPFYTHSDGKLPMRLNIHGGLRIRLSPRFNLTPQVIYLHQGEDFGNGRAHEMVASIYAQYMLSNTADLLFGATVRNKDAAIPFLGFHLGDFTLGMSYDINTSYLEAASLHQGGIELSLSYIRHKKIVDPQFICPRL